MSILAEKKLLTDIKVSIESIYEHIEYNFSSEVYKLTKPSDELLSANLK
jgi:GTP cyclohydrolase FolE2